MAPVTPSVGAEFRPLQIYEQVAAKLRAEIRAGQFEAGARLPSERELAARFKVGRPAVREALGALANEGLVRTRRNSGTYVADDAAHRAAAVNAAGPAEAADYSPTATLGVRLILEPAIVRLAAARRKRDRLAEHYLEQMELIVDVSDPAQQALWNESDRLFHRQLAIMTGDALIVKIAEEIAATMNQPLWRRLQEDGIHDPARIRLYVAEHRLIYEAIIDGNADAAAFYAEQHIHRVQRDIAPA
jgi:DNA-binding FadR family transcriptional regulator